MEKNWNLYSIGNDEFSNSFVNILSIFGKNLPYRIIKSIVYCFLLLSCKDTIPETQNNNKIVLLSNPTWLIQKATASNGVYELAFDKNGGSDPFQLAKVRAKFETNGTVSGTDNSGQPVNSGTWKFLENQTKIEVVGTGIFGVDGTITILTLEKDLLVFSNTMTVPSVSGTFKLDATLIPDK